MPADVAAFTCRKMHGGPSTIADRELRLLALSERNDCRLPLWGEAGGNYAPFE
jgi:hypothetical protein